MPQNGLHGLVGLRVAKWLTPQIAQELSIPFATSVTMGAMLPDIDLYPTAIAFLVGRKDLIPEFHRTLTHSVWVILLPAIVGGILRRRNSSHSGAWIAWGLALGIATHIVLDIGFWFSAIDPFWPLSHIPQNEPLLPIINIWSHFRQPSVFGNPDFIGNVLGAFEFAAFGLYLMTLRRLSANASSASLIRWERVCWLGFAIALVLSVPLNKSQMQILVLTPYLLALLPVCWLRTFHLRRELTHSLLLK